MAWPKHKNARTQEHTAHAPYNFVPLPEKVVTVKRDELPPHDKYANPHYTGYITCGLRTESPLYIRGPLTPHEFRLLAEQEKREKADEQIPFEEKIVHKPDFFYTNQQNKDSEPVIPGSSLRGMLRTLVEIFSYSKVSEVSEQKLYYRAVADQTLGRDYRRMIANCKAGYVVQQKKGDFAILPAEAVNGRTFFKVREEIVLDAEVQNFKPMYRYDYDRRGYRVRGEPDKKKYQPGWYYPVSYQPPTNQPARGRDRRPKPQDTISEVSGELNKFPRKGTIVCSGFIENKNKHTLVTAALNTNAVGIPPKLVEDYRESLTPFQQKEPFDKQNGCLVHGRPIFYLERSREVVWFGHTPNFRVPYRQGDDTATPRDFVAQSLRDENDLDLAEAIFGFTKKSDARAGRVFMTDARLEQPHPSRIWLSEQPEQPIRPHILASPKPTTFQHYLVQTLPDQPGTLKHYNSKPEQETVIRGHKLYWHKGEVTLDDIEGREETTQGNSEQDQSKEDTQHTLIKPLRAGLRFRFRIFFENLSNEELGALLWAIKLPGENRENYRHKLGMGKPYGMGSVRLESQLHLTDRHPRADRSGRYDRLFDDEGCWATGQMSTPESINVSIEVIKAFERHILSKVADEEKPGSFAELERIQSLLRMLEWPGPQDRKRTEYMELSEFRRRSVLPTPLPILPRRGIRRVRVKNYKSLADVDVRLGKLTILVGRNGTGKSNFIDVLRFVSEGISDLNKAISHKKRGGIDGIRRRSPDQLSPTISISINVEDDQFEGEYQIEIASDEKGLYELGLDKNGYYVSREQCSIQAESDFEDYLIEKGVLVRSLPELEYARSKATELHLNLLSRRPPFDRLYTILNELGFYSIDPDLLRFPQSIGTSRMLSEKGENLGTTLLSMQTNESEWLDEIKWALGEVVEGIGNVQAKESGGYSFIEFKHDWIDRPFEARQESEGTLRLLGLLVAMYQDQIPWLAAIEEPEKAIHPGVLALLHGAMRVTSEARSQLIITTHSPDFVANASANDLRVVEIENGVTKIAPIDEAQREIIYKELFSPGEIMRMGGFRRAK